MATRLIDTREEGTRYYTGPLGPALILAREDRHPVVSHLPSGDWTVDLYDHEGPGARLGEWGRGPTEEEAWRCALGALFGLLVIWDEADDAALQARLDRAAAQPTNVNQPTNQPTEGNT